MKEMLKFYFTNAKKIMGLIFGICGAVFVFVPSFSDYRSGVIVLLAVFIAGIIISICWSCIVIKRQDVTVYSSGKTKIIFEYADINELMTKSLETGEKMTMVVPANTALEYIFDVSNIQKHTIHSSCVEHMLNQMENDKLLPDIENVRIKKDGFSKNGAVGDWFLVTPEDFGYAGNISFLFTEIYELKKKNGKLVNDELTKEQFLHAIQSLMSAIPDVFEPEEKIYLPLIGAGAGNMGKPKDIMYIMASVLRFNKNSLKQEIHVIVNKKHKNAVPIYQLNKF